MSKIVLTAALLAAAAPAIAHAEAVTRQVHVSYADLDLHRAADVRLLDRRLRAAVGAVCPSAEAASATALLQCRKGAYAALADQRATALAKAGTTRLALNGATR
jgi:UrcA family protein